MCNNHGKVIFFIRFILSSFVFILSFYSDKTIAARSITIPSWRIYSNDSHKPDELALRNEAASSLAEPYQDGRKNIIVSKDVQVGYVASSFNILSTPPKNLIPPAWWESWWFYLLCLVAITIIYGSFYFNQARQLKRMRASWRELEKSKEKYRELVENQADLIVKLNADNSISFVNPSFCKLFGLAEQELIGSSYIPLVHENDREKSAKTLEELDRPPYTGYVEIRGRTKQGWRWFGWMGSTVNNKYENNKAYIFIGRDITEKKDAEEALQKNESLLNEVGRIAKIGGWEMDLIDRTAKWTRGTYEIVGLGFDEPVPGPDEHIAYYLPEYQPLVEEAMQKLIEEDIPLEFEAQLKTVGGKVIWTRALGRGIRKNDKCVKVFGTFQDITERKLAEKALQESEKTLSVIFNSSSDSQILTSVEPEGTYRIKAVNKSYIQALQANNIDIPIDEIIGKTIKEIGIDVLKFDYEVYEQILEYYNQAVESRLPVYYDDHYKSGNSEYYTKVNLVPVFDKEGICRYVLWTSHNVTESKLAEKALIEEKNYSENLINSMMDGVSVLDRQGVHITVNPSFCRIVGYTEKELIGVGVPHPYWPPEHMEEIQKALQKNMSGDFTENELVFMRKNGERFPVLISPSSILDDQGRISKFFGIIKDITERKLAEEQIKTSLAEKEILLRELYHRTKNNMQVIHSMLSLQILSSQDQKLHEILMDIQNKIQSMALVHQKLYQSRNLSSIDLKEYVKDLILYLIQSYHVNSKKFTIHSDIGNVTVLIDIAIPCGMILTELVSNALKHAFPGDRNGNIGIKIWEENDTITMLISDDGVGIPEGTDIFKSLGLQTVYGLISHQLQGQVQVYAEDGVRWTIQFKNQRYYPRI